MCVCVLRCISLSYYHHVNILHSCYHENTQSHSFHNEFSFWLLRIEFVRIDATELYLCYVYYTPRNEVRGGGILESPCPSVRLSVRLSVDARLGKMVSSA